MDKTSTINTNQWTHQANDFIEVEEHSHVSLGTTDETKPVPQSCNYTLYMCDGVCERECVCE